MSCDNYLWCDALSESSAHQQEPGSLQLQLIAQFVTRDSVVCLLPSQVPIRTHVFAVLP